VAGAPSAAAPPPPRPASLNARAQPIFFTGALCVIETHRLPQQERQLRGAVHWASHEPQERALACFNMDMDGARLLSRIISSHPSFKRSWKKFSVYEHDEYLIGRHGVDWMAANGGGGGGGGVRTTASSQALPRLKAPVNYPEGDPDAVSIDNSDLRRCDADAAQAAGASADAPPAPGWSPASF